MEYWLGGIHIPRKYLKIYALSKLSPSCPLATEIPNWATFRKSILSGYQTDPVPLIQNERKHCPASHNTEQYRAILGVSRGLVSAWEVWEESDSSTLSCSHTPKTSTLPGGRMAGPVGAATMVDSWHKMGFSLKYETACAALCQPHTARDTGSPILPNTQSPTPPTPHIPPIIWDNNNLNTIWKTKYLMNQGFSSRF